MADKRSKDAWRTYLDDPTPLNLLQVERERVRAFGAPPPRRVGTHGSVQVGWEVFLGTSRLLGPIYPAWGESREVSNAFGEWLVEHHDARTDPHGSNLPPWFGDVQVVITTRAPAHPDTHLPGARMVYPAVCSPSFVNVVVEEGEQPVTPDDQDDIDGMVALGDLWTVENYYDRNPEADMNGFRDRLVSLSPIWRRILARSDDEGNTPDSSNGRRFATALKAALSDDFWAGTPLLTWSVQTGEAWEGMGKDAKRINPPRRTYRHRGRADDPSA